MGGRIFLVFCLFLNILYVKGQTYMSVINTKSGPVRGIILTSIENVLYASFKGIPYAKPPVDYLRFKPPVEVNKWTNVYDAITEGSMCTQFNSTSNSAVGSEDCLYINVFTPHTKFNGSISKPVMVWIYGGAFTTGNSNASYYGPGFILGEDIIMVSFNYRVSALGFLNLEHENATGNCGLKDQNLALKWVKKNIAQFGGNPDKITIFGQSAGAASVDLQILSDMSDGLFNQSISMSGTPLNFYWGFQTSTEAVQNAFLLGSRLGTVTLNKNTLLKALHNSSAYDIVTAATTVGFIPFRPTLEKLEMAIGQQKFLSHCSVKKYETGNYAKGPHMLGFTANETVSFAESIADTLLGLQLVFAAVGNITSKIPFLSDLQNAINNGAGNLTDSALRTLIQQTTDLFFVLGIDTKQKLISRNNKYPIYYYRFSFETNYTLHQAVGINVEGVGHGDELPYLLYMPWGKPPLNQTDFAITKKRMVQLWTNFAKHGNPTPDGCRDKVLGVTWPDSRRRGEHLEIAKKLTTGPRPTDSDVKAMQSSGLGASPELNDCTV